MGIEISPAGLVAQVQGKSVSGVKTKTIVLSSGFLHHDQVEIFYKNNKTFKIVSTSFLADDHLRKYEYYPQQKRLEAELKSVKGGLRDVEVGNPERVEMTGKRKESFLDDLEGALEIVSRKKSLFEDPVAAETLNKAISEIKNIEIK